jgi:hypothetical protein
MKSSTVQTTLNLFSNRLLGSPFHIAWHVSDFLCAHHRLPATDLAASSKCNNWVLVLCVAMARKITKKTEKDKSKKEGQSGDGSGRDVMWQKHGEHTFSSLCCPLSPLPYGDSLRLEFPKELHCHTMYPECNTQNSKYSYRTCSYRTGSFCCKIKHWNEIRLGDFSVLDAQGGSQLGRCSTTTGRKIPGSNPNQLDQDNNTTIIHLYIYPQLPLTSRQRAAVWAPI